MTSIANTIRSAGARGAHNPWGIAPAQPNTIGIDMTTKPKTTMAQSKHLDPDELVICDDIIPPHRAKVANKYAPKFEQMKLGQALKVPSQHVLKVSNAMRKWIGDKKMDAHVRSIQVHPDCPQRLGRVWLMAGPQSSPPVSGAKRAA